MCTVRKAAKREVSGRFLLQRDADLLVAQAAAVPLLAGSAASPDGIEVAQRICRE